MRISSDAFLARYTGWFRAGVPGIAPLAYWKMKHLILTGEAHHLPECGGYYLIRDGHLLIYYAPDGHMHIPGAVLGALRAACLPADLYDSVEHRLRGLRASRGWSLRYDFSHIQPPPDACYEAVDFDFGDAACYARAAEIISGGSEWFTADNVRKMTGYAAFDPSLWCFARERSGGDVVGVSISAYDPDVRQADLDWFFVAPAYHGKGAGRFLIGETVRRCRPRAHSLCVGGAVEFYRKCGFVNDALWVWATAPDYAFCAPAIQP